ncbi:carboxypeptidase-like regulatory domain-containing protein [Hymenobacter cellulosivorans]|uniref:Carboxypeptidase-like regulatory domain-containing protein n=1 Tax=Hymenobacter cellulosivorans TaxID=2932249 RepID=A0ABY4FFQ4_9BACT|nr:carboxypeptidase-like regulatory domain-containing protein [Hymenobacter cellulosivorans]UOQ55235.1 carboxypeptidase-like regulatory domain-containing protein [Hymenobacter cellulosivorans]
MKLPLLLCFLLLAPWLAAAQSTTTISGQVIDAKSNQALPGATILQVNTVNGVSSSSDGSFSLTVPGQSDSVTISVSAIGYVKQQRRVAAGSSTMLRLEPDRRTLISDDIVVYTRYKVGLTSGLRYAPYGLYAQLRGQRYIHKSLNISGSYHTNFKRNYSATASVDLPALPQLGPLSFSEKLDYQRLRAEAANAQFNSYSATLGLTLYQKTTRLPELLLSAGYARYQPLHLSETRATTGYGHGLGLRYSLPYPLDIHMQAQATRWPSYWQYQGSISRFIGNQLQLSVAANQLRNYTKVSVSLRKSFF